MILPNLRVIVREITEDTVILSTEQGEQIKVPRHLIPDVIKDSELYLAADKKPLVHADQHAKDVLNEMIKN